MVKLNSADKYESIEIYLDEYKFPIAYKAKMNELIEQAEMTEQEAKDYIRTTPIEMELYYEEGLGMFLVEADAVECTTIYSPYTGEECKWDDND